MQYVAINQQVVLQNQHAVLAETAELLGLSMRLTEDQLTRDMLASTATMYNCTGGTNGDVPSDLSGGDIDEVTAALISNDAWMILQRQGGENKFGTAPVRDSFIALCHSNLIKDLNTLPNFIAKWNYPNDNKVMQSEWGSYNNTRWLVSSAGSITPNASALGNDVYNCFLCGMESYAKVEQDNYSSRIIFRPAIYSGPLAQNVTVSWVMAEVPKILQDLWITNTRCTLR